MATLNCPNCNAVIEGTLAPSTDQSHGQSHDFVVTGWETPVKGPKRVLAETPVKVPIKKVKRPKRVLVAAPAPKQTPATIVGAKK